MDLQQKRTVALPDGDFLLREADVALYLQVAPRTVINWRQKGLLPCFKIGRSIRYRRADLDRVLEERHRRGG